MIKQIGTFARRTVRTWLKAIYWKISPLYRRHIALENQCNAMNRQILDRIGGAVSELREDGSRWSAMNRQILDRIGGVESKLTIMNQRIETALFYKDITINALLINPDFIKEKNLFSYLELLRKNKKDIIIFIAVRDTPGLEFSRAIFEAMSEIGFKTDLTDKHWHSYVAVSGRGVVTEIVNPPGKESMFENNTGNLFVKLVSKDYNSGDLAFIGINDVDYSMNRRGLNIVVVDKTSQTVVDTVNFDTHLPDFPCNRHT